MGVTQTEFAGQLLPFPPGVERAVPEIFYRYYDRFLEQLKQHINGERLTVVPQDFPDGAVGLQYVYGNGTTESLPTTIERAVVPYWLVEAGGYRYRDTYGALDETLDALLGGPTHEQPVVNSATIFSPYLGVRSDHPSHNERGQTLTGEALYARMLASTLGKYGHRVNLVTLGLHGYDADNYFRQFGVSQINLTAVPLLLDAGVPQVDPQTRIVALDKGSLQRCLAACYYLGLDPNKFLVIFDKFRNDRGKLQTKLIYPEREVLLAAGGLKGKLIDDVIDTGSSAKENLEMLQSLGFEEASILTEHATLSYPARKVLSDLFGEGFLREVITTNSLPNAPFHFEELKQIKIVDCVPLMAAGAALGANFDLRDLRQHPHILDNSPFAALKPYLLQPLPKEHVWQSFAREAGVIPSVSSEQEMLGNFGM